MAEEFTYENLEADFLQLTQITPNTTLTVSEPFDEDLNPYISLLAISNKYGYLILGSSEGFMYIPIKDCINQLTSEEAKKQDVKSVELQNQIVIKIDEAKVQQIALSEDQLTIFVALSNNKILLYNISQLIKEKQNTQFFKNYNFNKTIKSIQLNPKKNDVFAILLDNEVRIENFDDNSTNILSTDSTSIVWSLDGEYIFSGNSQGEIEKLSMTKEKTQIISLPNSLTKSKVISIACQSDDIISAIYLNEEEEINTCIFTGVKDNNIKIIKCEDPCYGTFDKEQYFNVRNLSQISKVHPNILCFGCTTSPDLGVIGENKNEWTNWTLPDKYQVSVPLSPDDDDCYPYGMAIDYTSDIKLPGATPDEPAKEPVPILWILDSYGRLNGYHCVISDDGSGKSLLMTIPINVPEFKPTTAKISANVTEDKTAEIKKPNPFSFGNSNTNNKFPSTGFGFGNTNTDNKLPSTGFSFGNTNADNKQVKTEKQSTSSPFSFITPKNEEKSTSSPFSFATPKNEEKSTSSPFSFTTPKNEEKTAPSEEEPKVDKKSAASPFTFNSTDIGEKPATSLFTFNNPKVGENSTSSPTFSFTKKDEKPTNSLFNFNISKAEEKPNTQTTVKPEEKSSSSFNFLTPKSDGKAQTGFNFNTQKNETKSSPFSLMNSSINTTTTKTNESNNEIFGKPFQMPQKQISFTFNKSNETPKIDNSVTKPKQPLGNFSLTKSTPTPEKKAEILTIPKSETKKVTSVQKQEPNKAEIKVKPPSSSNYNHRFIESFNNNYILFTKEIDDFKNKINSTMNNINNIEIKTCPELAGTELAECSLNNSDIISNEIKELQDKVDDLNKQTISVNEYRLNILTELVKVEAKKNEIFKLLNSIKNNSYKKINMELGLGPEIEEAQNNIRSKIFKIENDIKDISEIIINIRKKMNKKADLIMEVPDLDKIYRSILYITQHTIKISNSLRNYDMEIRKLQNESLLKEKSFLLNTSKQPSTNVNDSLKPTLYDNILKNINKDETKDTEREKITSQKIQFKKLLRLALTSGRTTLFNDNVKSVESISIVRQDDDTEPEEDDDVNDEDYVENEVLSQDDDDNNEYDSNDDEYYEYLEDDEEYNEDEDGDIIDGENDDDDDDDDEPAKPSTLSLFSKKAPINPNFNLQLKDKKFNINPFGATTTQSKFKAAETKGFDYAASGFQKQIDPEGTWTCNVCMVKNKPDVNQCIACENEKPGSKKSEDISEKPAVTFGGPNKFGISFGANSSTSSPFDPSKFPSFTAATATKSEDKKPEAPKTSTTSTTSTTTTPAINGFDYAAAGLKKQADPEGTWTCNACMVKNKPDATQCIACENEKPGSKKSEDISEKPAVTFGGPNKFGISFGANSSTSSPFDPSKFPSFTAATATKSEDKKPEAPKTSTTSTTSTTTTPATNGFDYAAAGLKKQADPEGTWTCNVCMVKNKPDATQCIACENEKPGSKKSEDISKKPVVTFGSTTFNVTFGNIPSTTTPTTTLEKKKPEEKEQEIEEKKDEKIDGKIEEKVEEKEEEKIEKEKEEEKKTSTSTPKQIIGFSFTPSLNNNNDKNNIDSNSLEKKSIPEPPKSVGFSLPSSFSNNNNNDKDDSDSDSLEKSESMDDKDDNEDVDDLDIDTATEKFLDESSFGLGSTAKNETHNVFGISTSKPNTSSSLTTTSATTSTTFGAFGGGNTTNVSFGQPSFGQTTFGKPLGFGQSTFGKPLGFGQSTFGQNATPVSTTTNQQGNSVLNSGFGNAFSNQPKSSSDTPVFGAKTSIGFGATSMMGGMGSAFGSTSTLNNNSPFGTASTSAFNTGGGFGAFANNNNQSSFSSFASAAANANNNNNGGSIFGNGGSFNTDNNTFGYGNSTKKFTEYR